MAQKENDLDSLDLTTHDDLAGEDFNFGEFGDDLDLQHATLSDQEMESFDLKSDGLDIGNDDFSLVTAQDDDFSFDDKIDPSEQGTTHEELSLETDLDEVMNLSEEDQEPLQFDLAGEADELDQGIEAEELEAIEDSPLTDEEPTLILSDDEVAGASNELSLITGFEGESLKSDEEPFLADDPPEDGLLDLDSSFEEVSTDELDLEELSLAPESDELAWIPEEIHEPPVITPTPNLKPVEVEEQKIAPELLLNLEHEVSIEVGKATLKGHEIADLSYGSVILLDKEAGDTVDLKLNGQILAHGEVVLINYERLGVRVIGFNVG